MISKTEGRARWIFGALAAMVLLALGAQSSAAQETYSEFGVDPRLGVAFPVGDLADTHEFGFSAGLGVSYYFHRHVAVRGDVEVSVLDDESPQFGVVLAPPLTLVNFNAGIELDFPRPDYQEFPLTFRWYVGGGGTSMSASRDFPTGEDIDFSATYPSVTSAVKIGYQVAPDVETFVGGQAYLIFTDEAETLELVQRAPQAGPFGAAWSMPVTAGVQIKFR